jgi:hypothetical protein
VLTDQACIAGQCPLQFPSSAFPGFRVYVGIPKRLIDEFQQLHFWGRFLDLFDYTRMLVRRHPITTILELSWRLVLINEVEERRQLVSAFDQLRLSQPEIRSPRIQRQMYRLLDSDEGGLVRHRLPH